MSTITPATSTVFSLYRSFRRQVNLLPSDYLRLFFRIKLADDVRKTLKAPEGSDMRRNRVKKLQRGLRKVQAANNSDVKAFAYVTDIAYGRVGKFRRELMDPILAVPPNTPLPDPIIPPLEKTRPPVITPELRALLTSTTSRSNKIRGLKPSAIDTPNIMPERADPNSEEAKVMGPFSKRREFNIRTKFFKTEWLKVIPPLQVVVEERSNTENTYRTDQQAIHRAGIRSLALQDLGLFEEIQDWAGPANRKPSPTRKERKAESQDASSIELVHIDSHLPQRYLRKRYQQLLSRIPMLTYSYKSPEGNALPSNGKYSVSLHPSAIAPSLRLHHARLPPANATDLAWLAQAQEEEKRQRSSQVPHRKSGKT